MAESSTQQQPSSLEIDLQFDENGRTRCNNNNGRQEIIMDYNPKTVMTNLKDVLLSSDKTKGSPNETNLLDDLLFDCEIADCGLLPRTYWMPVGSNQKPRCRLEEMALQIFHHHVKGGSSYNPETSGAEWWVQLRPSPPGMGRYAMLTSKTDNSEKNKENDDDMTKSGISFHWDKDEDLRIAAGGNLYVHPHLSTVTYLSKIGAPTMVCNRRVHPVTGQWLDSENEDDEGYLCWPRLGKHLSFDGRYLHAAPPNFLLQGEWESQTTIEKKKTELSKNQNEIKLSQRRHRRVTFLVNIWLNHKPFNVEMFPEPMVEKLSKLNDDNFQLFPSNTPTLKTQTLKIKSNNKEEMNNNNDSAATTASLSTLTWPMGGCESEERISIQVPLDEVRREYETGPNFHLLWRKDTFVLSDNAVSQVVTANETLNGVEETSTKKQRLN